jgi:hypothetical protein
MSSSNSRVKRSAAVRAPAASAEAEHNSDFSMTRYDMLASAESFDEPMDGLHTRELLNVDVFRHYFGGLVARQ